MLHLICAVTVIAALLHHQLTPNKESTKKTHLSQTWLRIVTWALLLLFVSYNGTNEPLTLALQLSLSVTILHDVCELRWHDRVSMLTYLALIMVSTLFRAGGMWCIIAADATHEVELVLITTVTSLIALIWFLITPVTDGKPKLPLGLYSFATLMQLWLALEVVLHKQNDWYQLLIAASVIYAYSFYRFYRVTYYQRNDDHLSCPPSSLILANLLMVVTATLTV